MNTSEQLEFKNTLDVRNLFKYCSSRFSYYFFIFPISKLPFCVLYFFSNLLFILNYYTIGFRKKIVSQNIDNSFPHLSKKERQKIKKKFYKNIMDVFMESLKMFSISEKEALKRVTFKNTEIVDRIYDEGRNAIMMYSHCNNWEACITAPCFLKHKIMHIYKPIRSAFLNKKLLSSRQKFGVEFVTPKLVRSRMFARSGDKSFFIFSSDQSPHLTKKVHWTKFLNQDTCFLKGAETYAKAFNYPVIYAIVNRVSKGHYEMVFELIHDNPKETPDGYITEAYARLLERDILKNPECWLWTHRRWKTKKEKNIS